MHVKQIVVCEDDPKTLRDLRIILNTSKSKIIKEFNDGFDFLNWFKDNYKQVDIVILDIVVKKIDGFALFHEIKKIKPEIPVIIISIENSVAVVKYLVFHGIKDYITKPYQLEQIRKRLQNIIDNL